MSPLKNNIKRFLPFLLLLALMGIVYACGWTKYLTLHALRTDQLALHKYVTSHPLLSPLLFILIYIASICLIIPDSTFLMLLSGFLFPLPLALSCVILSETLGALIFFFIIRYAFSDWVAKRNGKLLNKIRTGFHKYGISFLLFLRWIHIFPFWAINAASACFNVPPWRFTWTCALGVAPVSYLLVAEGSSLSTILHSHHHFTIDMIFTLQVKIALIVLGLLALLPILYQKLRSR